MIENRHPRRTRVAAALAWLMACAAGPASARGDWVDQRVVGVFVCRAEFPLNEAASLLGELEQLQADLVAVLRIPRAEQPIELLLFDGRASYERHLARNLPGVQVRRALYVKRGGVGLVYAYRGREFETDVRHECTHGLLHAALGEVPLWLDEGLAEYFESPRGERAVGSPYQFGLRWSARLGRLPNLEALEKKEGMEETGQNDYRNAWAWVHFLLHGPPAGREELTHYLAALGEGGNPDPLSRRLRRRIPDLEAQFAQHLRSWPRPAERQARQAAGALR